MLPSTNQTVMIVQQEKDLMGIDMILERWTIRRHPGLNLVEAREEKMDMNIVAALMRLGRQLQQFDLQVSILAHQEKEKKWRRSYRIIELLKAMQVMPLPKLRRVGRRQHIYCPVQTKLLNHRLYFQRQWRR